MMTAVLTILLWCAGWLVLGRIRACRVSSAGQHAMARELSIIIPARNEESNLPRLLRSIATQASRPLEVIVVNDASTDGTASVARSHGALVLESAPLPAGWRGKTWACSQGARIARGRWLMFLDADTWLEPGGLEHILAEFSEIGSGALSVAPHHQVGRLHEQGSAFFNLVMLAGTRAFTLLGDRTTPAGLLGQCLLIDRHSYDRVGGHEPVKQRILENFWLARELERCGVPMRCRAGRGAISFRMYPGNLRELVEGWAKGFASGATRTSRTVLLLVVAWMTGLMLPALALCMGSSMPLWLCLYGLCVFQVGWLLRRAGTFHPLTAVLYPLPLMFYFVVFAHSLRLMRSQSTVAWKGREIHAG